MCAEDNPIATHPWFRVMAIALCPNSLVSLNGQPIGVAEREKAKAIGTNPLPATSAGELGSPLPHLHQDWAHPGHIRTGTECKKAQAISARAQAPCLALLEG